MKTFTAAAVSTTAFFLLAGCARAQFTSPPADTAVTIAGKKIAIQYHAPSMHNRKIFGGLVPFGEVWRAGANEATALHTGADLTIGGLNVPKGDYTLFILPSEKQWQLIVNKQTGQWGLEYHQERDLGRVPMQMNRLPNPVNTFKITLTQTGGNRGLLQMEWDTTMASLPFTVK